MWCWSSRVQRSGLLRETPEPVKYYPFLGLDRARVGACGAGVEDLILPFGPMGRLEEMLGAEGRRDLLFRFGFGFFKASFPRL